ncbi:hypothetical protein DVH24_010759 [Malus domestica]|uniref:Uncharacterized protein n=1 Tax=Malus domestica TaxID=3750 RepID=A0A498JXC9_MALDO|nr:hypothetical protein DVH24_010759 [Malus domestica]
MRDEGMRDEGNSTLGGCSGDRRRERARGPVDRALALGSPSEGGSSRARPWRIASPAARGTCPSLASGGASDNSFTGHRACAPVSAGGRWKATWLPTIRSISTAL